MGTWYVCDAPVNRPGKTQQCLAVGFPHQYMCQILARLRSSTAATNQFTHHRHRTWLSTATHSRWDGLIFCRAKGKTKHQDIPCACLGKRCLPACFCYAVSESLSRGSSSELIVRRPRVLGRCTGTTKQAPLSKKVVFAQELGSATACPRPASCRRVLRQRPSQRLPSQWNKIYN